MQLQEVKPIQQGGQEQGRFGYQERMMIVVLLYLLQPSAAIPIQFPYRGSNSEEGTPQGLFNYPNLQLPHAGSMYGFGLPYSQMIQLQHALSSQSSPWQPQGKAQIQQNNRETVSHQMPTFQMNPQHQPIPAQQPQHVSKQPLQHPSAPQTPPMFLPFANPINPFWPQGNYLGYYGFGGRQPFNSEEANEDEEAAQEKESPKKEAPVIESNNATIADTNTTTVEQGLGNSTTQNDSLVGINPQNSYIGLNEKRMLSPGRQFTANINGRHVNILPGAHRPQNHIITLPNSIVRHPQQRYYVINRDPLENEDHQKQAHTAKQVINKESPIHLRPSEKKEFVREETPVYLENGLRRISVPRGNDVREVLHSPSLTVYRNNIQQPIDLSQQRENRNRMANNGPNRNILIVYPQDTHHQDNVFPDENQNLPRGIYANNKYGRFQSKPSETGFSDHGGVTEIQNSKGGIVTADSIWNRKHHISEISRGDSGPLQETIYLVNTLPSINDPHNSPPKYHWASPAFHGNIPYSPGQRETEMYPENDPYEQITPTPVVEKQLWKVNDFTTQQEKEPQPYSQIGTRMNRQNPSAGQIRKEFYTSTNERYPLSHRQFLLISKPDPLRTEEQLFLTNRSSYKLRNVAPISQMQDSILDPSGFFSRLENDSPGLNSNLNYPYDYPESIQYTYGDEIHPEYNNPNDFQISFPETQSWNYNPEDFPTEPKDQTYYGSYPSNLRGQPSNQREIEMYWNGGSRHYICSLPLEDYPRRGLPNSLLYLCCKPSHTKQGSPTGTIGNIHNFRAAVKEYNDWVPYQDRTHKQHTRNVIDSPKAEYNKQSMSKCNISNDIALTSGKEPSEGSPCMRNVCDEQNLENDYQPCAARGDNFLLTKQEMPSPQSKTFIAHDEGSSHRVEEKKGSVKLLRLLTCPQDRQMPVADKPSDKSNAIFMKHDTSNGEPTLKTQDANVMLHQPSEPLSSTPGCLLLNK